MPRENDDWFTCPNCGEVVRDDALACPACGADDETGWSEDAAYDDLDLPSHDDQTLENHGTRSRRLIGIGLALLMAGLILFLSIGGRW